MLLGSYGAACDMWSMGVIAYMMLSGAPPFWGSSDTQVQTHKCILVVTANDTSDYHSNNCCHSASLDVQ